MFVWKVTCWKSRLTSWQRFWYAAMCFASDRFTATSRLIKGTDNVKKNGSYVILTPIAMQLSLNNFGNQFSTTRSGESSIFVYSAIWSQPAVWYVWNRLCFTALYCQNFPTTTLRATGWFPEVSSIVNAKGGQSQGGSCLDAATRFQQVIQFELPEAMYAARWMKWLDIASSLCFYKAGIIPLLTWKCLT